MHLSCHSYFSLRYGTLSVENLVEEAVMKNASVMALTDINNSTGIMDFVATCNEKGVKPVAGIEFRSADRLLYTGLAKNNEGFRELNEFLSRHNLGNLPFPDRAPEFEHAFVIYPLQNSEIRHPSPVTCHASPVTRHSSPVTRHPSPVTRHPSLVTRNASPVTRHPSPVTCHQKKNSRKTPAASETHQLQCYFFLGLISRS